jgi:hypothetical protein
VTPRSSGRPCARCTAKHRYLRPETGYLCADCRAAADLPRVRECGHCNAVFSGRQKRFCSDRCQKRARDRRNYVPRARKPVLPPIWHQWKNAQRSGYRGSLDEYAEYRELRQICGGHSRGAWKRYDSAARRMRLRAGRPPRTVRPSETSAERWRRRYRSDPTFMVWQRQKNQFKKWFKGEHRTNALARAIGYSRDELRTHIERQFVGGMSWSNYGQWHIDHYIPKNLFDPHCDADVRMCWSLSNLRPLWARDNLRRPRDGRDVLNVA